MLTIDPGLRTLGWALWTGDRLEAAGLVRRDTGGRGPEQWAAMARGLYTSITPYRVLRPVTLVCEIPQVYRRGKCNPADLIELAGVVGACVGQLNVLSCEGVLPAAWKGQVPKRIHQKRILGRLGPEEAKVVTSIMPEGLRHNAIDAVGIGLWKLQRH
jgi:hypothetical protein